MVVVERNSMLRFFEKIHIIKQDSVTDWFVLPIDSKSVFLSPM